MIRDAALLVLLVSACAGREQPAGPTPLYSESYPSEPEPSDSGPPPWLTQCLPEPLPVGANGMPDCVVVRARFPHSPQATATPDDIDACRACDEPGLSPVSPSIPLASINADLPSFDCVCVVNASGPCPDRGPGPPTPPQSWCYNASFSDAFGYGCSTPTSITFGENTARQAAVYLACFAQGTVPQ
jgi:hypothetical protein